MSLTKKSLNTIPFFVLHLIVGLYPPACHRVKLWFSLLVKIFQGCCCSYDMLKFHWRKSNQIKEILFSIYSPIIFWQVTSSLMNNTEIILHAVLDVWFYSHVMFWPVLPEKHKLVAPAFHTTPVSLYSSPCSCLRRGGGKKKQICRPMNLTSIIIILCPLPRESWLKCKKPMDFVQYKIWCSSQAAEILHDTEIYITTGMIRKGTTNLCLWHLWLLYTQSNIKRWIFNTLFFKFTLLNMKDIHYI